MIYLIRHGQTVFNVERRLQGSLDSPLTPLGQAQARNVGRRLRPLIGTGEGWTIVSSPLGRARASAAIIKGETEIRREIEIDDRLREISMGAWDGMTHAEVEAAGGVIGDQPVSWWFDAPGGETFDGFFGRLQNWLQEASARPDNLIVVSHAGASRMIRGAYLGLTPDEMFDLPAPHNAFFRLDAGEIARIDCEPVS